MLEPTAARRRTSRASSVPWAWPSSVSTVRACGVVISATISAATLPCLAAAVASPMHVLKACRPLSMAAWLGAASAKLVRKHDIDAVLSTDDLVKGDNCFFAATGITNGDMVRGVSYRSNGAVTRSLVMRSKSGTIRYIDSIHKLSKLQEYSVVDYTTPTKN